MRLTVSRQKCLPLKMQINIYRLKVLRYFKSHYFRRISYLEKDLASVLFPGGFAYISDQSSKILASHARLLGELVFRPSPQIRAPLNQQGQKNDCLLNT